MIDEAGILMGKAVMVLPPHVRAQKIVQRRDRTAPRNLVTYLQPLGVLVEHGIYDVDEGLVTTEKSVTAGQQIAFQPALALMLAEHLHHASVGRQVVVFR